MSRPSNPGPWSQSGGAGTRSARPPAPTERAIPAYHRLYVLLSEHIRDGVYPVGEMLPSENDLVHTYGYSRVTVRRALDLLVAEGLVRKRRGQGSVVAVPDSNSAHAARLKGPVDDLVARGIRLTSTELHWGLVIPPKLVRETLGLPSGERCLLIRRVRRFNGSPVSYSSIYLPQDVGGVLDRASADHRLILEMLDETPYRPLETEHTLTATVADGEVASSLSLPVGSPVLRMRGVAVDAAGRRVYFQESLYHPAKYEYAVRLTRGRKKPSTQWRPAKPASSEQ